MWHFRVGMAFAVTRADACVSLFFAKTIPCGVLRAVARALL